MAETKQAEGVATLPRDGEAEDSDGDYVDHHELDFIEPATTRESMDGDGDGPGGVAGVARQRGATAEAAAGGDEEDTWHNLRLPDGSSLPGTICS